MITIKLDMNEWKYDPTKPLGPRGGFGTVFAGTGSGKDKLAIKKLNIDAKDAAHRELRIAKDLAGRKLSHVIPIFDSGQDAESDSYFVVMALAEKSLQDELGHGKIFSDTEASGIMLQIIEGLSEVDDIVHRDLKPGNVLFHEEKWKVTDFGIARFVEESTSLQTLKECLTPPYAAPEQWQLEHVSTATDIYALGCIGYALLTGQPPFKGPNTENFKAQHLNEVPPQLNGRDPRFNSLLTMMLRKAPDSRPSRERVKHILKEVIKNSNKPVSKNGLGTLAQVSVDIATWEAEEEAKENVARLKEEKRKSLAAEAFKVLEEVVDKMFGCISSSAPAAKYLNRRLAPPPGVTCPISKHDGAIIVLGKATLMVKCLHRGKEIVPENAFFQSGWEVILGGKIEVVQFNPKYIWSSSLWYSKLPTDSNYRWREVSYCVDPLRPERPSFEPFAFEDFTNADKAASSIMDFYQIAFGPKPIDDENFDDFCNRWADLLAKAAKGELRHPRQLPLN